MKVYILFKTKSQEEDYGKVATAPSILCGVFEDEASAVLAKIELEKKCDVFKAQFGEAQDTVIMVVTETDKVTNIETE